MAILSVSYFPDDESYQAYCRKLIEELGLDDGYCHIINMDGTSRRLRKMGLTPNKISKSDQSYEAPKPAS